MKLKKAIKALSIVSLASLLIFSSFTIVTNSYLNNNFYNLEQDNLNEKKLGLFTQNIQEKSIILGNEKYYKYDEKIFQSEEELNEYIYGNQKIKSFLTSSNPNMIIKDFENDILDENKIYDTDVLNNFVQVFETAHHNATIDRETALRSFINRGNSYQEYSYDKKNWYSTETDAKEKFTEQLEVNKSLYYLIDGKYYNAFNAKDNQFLVSGMEDGYYLEMLQTLSGNKLSKPNIITASKKEFAKVLKPYLKQDFIDNYYKKLFNYKKINGLKININKFKPYYSRPPSDYWNNKLRYHTSEGPVMSINGKKYLSNSGKIDIRLENKSFESYYSMLQDFKDKTKWWITKENKRGTGGRKDIYDTVYNRYFDLYINGELKKNSHVKLYHLYGTWMDGDPGYGSWEMYPIEFDFDKHVSYEDITDLKFNFYKDEEKKSFFYSETMDKLYAPNLTNDQISNFFEKWYDEYYSKEVLFDFGLNKNEIVNWENIKNGNYIKNINKKLKIGNLYKDKRYDANGTIGYKKSLISSMENWHKDLKNKIINQAEKEYVNEINEDLKIYKIWPNLKVRKSDLDNFLNLESPRITARVMFSAEDKMNSSDQTGKWLSESEYHTQEKRRSYLGVSMRTRYIIEGYDGIVYNPIYTDDIDQAIEKLKSELKLNSRFVNKDEYFNFEKRYGYKPTWKDLVSDGKYIVYRIDSLFGNKGIWFKSEKKALEQLKINLKVFNNLEELNDKFLIYHYTDNKGELKSIKFRERDIKEVARKLFDENKY